MLCGYQKIDCFAYQISFRPESLRSFIIGSSLITAGAVSGYISFRYKEANTHNHVESPRLFWSHLVVGHFATGFMLLVIGTLLAFVAALLSYRLKCIGLSAFQFYPFIVGLGLYTSLVLFDLFDFLTLVRKLDEPFPL